MDKILLLGLGNPGKDYQIRHNVGFMFLDSFERHLHDRIFSVTKDVEVTNGFKNGTQFICVKPLVGYNNSGEVLEELFQYHRLTMDDMIVVHDDVDLSLCRVKAKKGGGSGGCNGIKSIDSCLGSSDYSRIRIGIGRPPNNEPVDGKFVCGVFTPEEQEKMDSLFNELSEDLLSLESFDKVSLASLNRK